MEFRWSGLVHDFGLGMQCSFPEHREGLTEWKAEIGDGVQGFLGKLFARNVALCEMEGDGLSVIFKFNFTCYFFQLFKNQISQTYSYKYKVYLQFLH